MQIMHAELDWRYTKMANMSLHKIPMPEQPPEVRNKNFNEVALGYTPEMAMEEATRCLNCKNKPCIAGCPVNVLIPEFIMKVAAGEFEAAFDIIKTTNCLPAVCGRVCPQESQCEEKCIRGIKGEPVGIGRLERFVADYHMENSSSLPVAPPSNGHKVAVIGAGPAGLTCASDLALLGYKVSLFEAFHKPGGVLVYGIPEFRLPKALVQKEIDNLCALGVEIITNMVIGKILSVDELFENGYEAVFIGSGAGLPSFMNIEGESLIGVYSANEYLTRANLMKAYDNDYDTPIRKSKAVAVVGGGNVAMDAARTAKRLGAETVYIVYRRSEAEMPARAEEVHHAKEEGIIFKNLNNPVKILGGENGEVVAMECIQMDLGEPDDSGRRRPVEKPGSNFILDVDTVIIAIGTSPNPLIRNTTTGLDTNKWGCIVADDAMATSKPGVFAGGDAVTGAATVILAMGAGKIAAASMDAYIRSKS
jgi:glutamate synthase (NADPH/NADH) small chain